MPLACYCAAVLLVCWFAAPAPTDRRPERSTLGPVLRDGYVGDVTLKTHMDPENGPVVSTIFH